MQEVCVFFDKSVSPRNRKIIVHLLRHKDVQTCLGNIHFMFATTDVYRTGIRVKMADNKRIVKRYGVDFDGWSVCEMRGPRKSIITFNKENWSVPPHILKRFGNKKINYRAYVVAHEFGHAIHSYDHVEDAGRGKRCHFMTQQSKRTLCTPGVLK